MFKEFDKVPRFYPSEICFTEKIDGTNGCIIVDENNKVIGVQSRQRLIVPGDDNYGFAKWVDENKDDIGNLLGQGYHYGEWWGKGIQRGYDMDRKVFSLFNVHRWKHLQELDAKDTLIDCVPYHYFSINNVKEFSVVVSKMVEDVESKKVISSSAKKYGIDYKNVEGFMIWHDRLKTYMKFPVNK